jgi:long-subunit fatty acid transport protein
MRAINKIIKTGAGARSFFALRPSAFHLAVLSCFLLLVANPCLFSRGAGTSSGSILKIDAGARAAGMAGSFCGISNDVTGIYYNPAGLVQIDRQEFVANHNEWLQGVRSEFLGYGLPINEDLSVGITMNYLYVNGLVGRDEFGNETGSKFGGYDGLVTLTAAGRLTDEISIGGNVKVVQESVDDKKATGYCGDVGVMYKYEALCCGLAIQNAGSKIKLNEDSFPLPMNLKLGASYTLFESLTVDADVNKPLDNDIVVSAGAEWWVVDAFAVRAGYKMGADKNTGIGVTAGAGFKLDDYSIDYSFLPYGDLGNTHRLSLTYRFGENK